eukprot:5172586-Amphidinium_carterae.1
MADQSTANARPAHFPNTRIFGVRVFNVCIGFCSGHQQQPIIANSNWQRPTTTGTAPAAATNQN